MPVFLPREFHGQGSLTGYSPWAHRVSDMTKQLTLSLSLGGPGWYRGEHRWPWAQKAGPLKCLLGHGTFVLSAPLCVCYRGGTRGMTVSDEWIHKWIKLTWMEVKFNVNEKNKHHSEDTLKNNFHILFICLHPSKWLTVMCGKKIPWKGYYSLMTKLRELPKCLVMIAFIWDLRLVNSFPNLSVIWKEH